MTEEPDEEPYHRTYWHSEHYQNLIGGNGLVGPVWDALCDHPTGLTVPQVRDLLVNDRRVRAAQSWFISFGTEQRLRPASDYEDRYKEMDPEAYRHGEDSVWTWDAERRFRYTLLERVWHQVQQMVTTKQARVLGPSGDYLKNSELFQVIPKGTGKRDVATLGRYRGLLPLYGAGKLPLVTDINPRCECGKVHHKTYKRRWVHHEGLGPDPYVLRQNWLVDVDEALARGRLPNARELLERGRTLMGTT